MPEEKQTISNELKEGSDIVEELENIERQVDDVLTIIDKQESPDG